MIILLNKCKRLTLMTSRDHVKTDQDRAKSESFKDLFR